MCVSRAVGRIRHVARKVQGLVVLFAAGGLGSVACALAMGQRDIPRRGITFIYAAWTLATLAVAGYGLSSALWQLMLAALAFNALETGGTIVWATMKQQHVPRAMLGRVSSLDWLISIGLLPPAPGDARTTTTLAKPPVTTLRVE
jgi:hypothetical protein